MMKLAAVIMNMTILVIALVFFTGMTCGVPNRPRRAGTLNQAQDQGGGGRSLYLRQLGETNGQHLRDSARMRCHSPSTKHTGGLRLFSREFPESDLFWLKRSFQKICVIKQMQEKIRRGE